MMSAKSRRASRSQPFGFHMAGSFATSHRRLATKVLTMSVPPLIDPS
jgi:hypothetical protein